jgi:hypothetical protein
MDPGDQARSEIEGHDLDSYLRPCGKDARKRLPIFATIGGYSPSIGLGPTDNSCRWYRVCERECHHPAKSACSG